mgnify:FL=1|tara:strand:- start:178 stop:630 length:453 start_codon:yes stop_codon:yes gene_type:complete
MKSFEQFKKDLSEMDRSIAGTGLVGAGLRGMLNVASGPLRKGVKAVTSFASTMDNFKERRKARIDLEKAVNKGIQNVRDPEADKEVAKAAKDPDLEKFDRLYDTSNKDFNKDVKSYRKTINKDTKKTTLTPEDQIKRLKDAKNKYKEPKK